MRRSLFAAVAAAALLGACESQSGSPVENAAQPSEQSAPVSNIAAPAAEPIAREAALKLMHDRHENMEKIGDAMKVAGRTLKSDSPDLAAVRASADTIATLAPQVPGWFPPGTGPDVGKTMAKPGIWEKPEDFAAKAHALNQAAQAFQAAAQGSDVEAIRARFADLGKTCKACHEPYRTEHDD